MQFSSYFNIFFLFSAILLSIPELSPLKPSTTISPVAVVFAFGMIRELIQDLKRHAYDKTNNNSLSLVYRNDIKRFHSEKWLNMSVGSIVKILKNEMVPADILVIKTSDENGFCYLQTTNLDGESTLKSRESVLLISSKITTEESIIDLKGYIEVDLPNSNIYKTEGRIELKSGERTQFDMNNVVLRGGWLRNINYIYGIVIYSGKDTKLMKNIKIGSNKLSSIERKLNKIVILVMIITFAVCFVCTVFGIIFKVRG